MPGAKMDTRPSANTDLKKLNLSDEELGRFEKAMKDPKFVELLSDYAREMADPRRREENEQYLRQLEREGQAGAVDGEGVELVAPHAGFCIKTKNKVTGSKAFINICHSKKISVATSTARPDGSGADWSIPYSLSTARADKDKGGKACEVHDFVIASKTLHRCQADGHFKTFVIETALDSVEAQRQCRLDRSFALPKLKFKGPGESPPVLAVKGFEAPSKVTGKDSPVSTLQPSKLVNGTASPFLFDKKGGAKSTEKEGANAANQALLGQAAKDDSLENPDHGARDGKTSTHENLAGAKIEDVTSRSAGEQTGVTQPKYEIVQQGMMDLSSFWSDERREVVPLSRPESLLLRVDLPLLASASAVELDVSERRVVLTANGSYHLDVSLPYPVEDSKGRAKFDKVRRRLEVTLPVVRPPDPPKKRFEEPSPGASQEETAEHREPVVDQEDRSESATAPQPVEKNNFDEAEMRIGEPNASGLRVEQQTTGGVGGTGRNESSQEDPASRTERNLNAELLDARKEIKSTEVTDEAADSELPQQKVDAETVRGTERKEGCHVPPAEAERPLVMLRNGSEGAQVEAQGTLGREPKKVPVLRPKITCSLAFEID